MDYNFPAVQKNLLRNLNTDPLRPRQYRNLWIQKKKSKQLNNHLPAVHIKFLRNLFKHRSSSAPSIQKLVYPENKMNYIITISMPCRWSFSVIWTQFLFFWPQSWCWRATFSSSPLGIDCNVAEPVIYQKLAASADEVALLRAFVGDRPTWRTPVHPWRVDPLFKIRGVPTLIRWDGDAIAGRLEDYEAHVPRKIDALLQWLHLPSSPSSSSSVTTPHSERERELTSSYCCFHVVTDSSPCFFLLDGPGQRMRSMGPAHLFLNSARDVDGPIRFESGPIPVGPTLEGWERESSVGTYLG